MASNKRDIGAFNGSTIPVKVMELSNRGQVYLATHDGEGNSLSAVEKSFISFSWGGKNIEDFSLIVVNDGSRYNDRIYSDFQDLTTDYEIVDGQNYWGTSFSAGTKEFQLATDGMTEKEFQAFRNWFRPGIARELILAEKPNRAISARVASAPQYSLLPFEHTEVLTISGTSRDVSSTIWKGTITVTFIMDDPFWYSTADIFLATNNHLTQAELRSVMEDGVPNIEMLKQSCLLSNNGYFNGSSYGINSGGIMLSPANKQYVYYCGTGKAKPKISFDLAPQMTPYPGNGDIQYITIPKNKYGNQLISPSDSEYTYIKVRNTDRVVTQNFQFTTPGIYADYNLAIDILQNHFDEGDSILEFMDAIRESISNYYVRTTLIAICEICLSEGKKTSGTHLSVCNSAGKFAYAHKGQISWYLRQMFHKVTFTEFQPSSGSPNDYPYYDRATLFHQPSFTFDSATGEAVMDIPIYILDPSQPVQWFHLNTDQYPLNSIMPYKTSPVPVRENVGDMVRSNFIVLEDRTLPAENNTIYHEQCLELSTNCTLNNFKIDYKYMYL